MELDAKCLKNSGPPTDIKEGSVYERRVENPVNIMMVSWAVLLTEKRENEFSFLVLISLSLLLLLCLLLGIRNGFDSVTSRYRCDALTN